eukprot:scaffold41381_cov329-Skeletonema_marinoi.AAC.1
MAANPSHHIVSHAGRNNVVGDVMRANLVAASSSVDDHIVCHAVNMAINSFEIPIIVGHDSIEASPPRLKYWLDV